LRHLDRCNEILGARLMTMHNLWFYQELMQGLRQAIENDELGEYSNAILLELARGPE
jgi:queuine tRNA-ribosyltransferase